jgi:maltose alpha-D-glucosyltransferase/alpha-amylase
MAFSLVKNDPGWKATSQYWQDVREEIQKDFPQAALIAEWSYPSAAIEAGFHGDFMIHIPNEDVYNTLFRMEKQNDAFDRNGDGHSYFSSAGKGDISVFLKKFNCHRDNIGKSGFVFLPSGNHDIIRISSGRTAKELEIVFAFLLTMPVVPTVYYGDEIGMHNIHGLISKEGGYKRTGARTPMQWSKEPNAGFSKASQDKLYLPVDKNKDAPDVQSQIKKDDSLLNAVRKLIWLRKNNPALNPNAEYAELYVEKDTYPCIYLRQKEDIKFVIILNPSNRKHSVEIKTELELIKFSKIIGNNIEISRHGDHYKIGVEPVSYSILRNDF